MGSHVPRVWEDLVMDSVTSSQLGPFAAPRELRDSRKDGYHAPLGSRNRPPAGDDLGAKFFRLEFSWKQRNCNERSRHRNCYMCKESLLRKVVVFHSVECDRCFGQWQCPGHWLS